jgi:hypothetical protein
MMLTRAMTESETNLLLQSGHSPVLADGPEPQSTQSGIPSIQTPHLKAVIHELPQFWLPKVRIAIAVNGCRLPYSI